MKKWEVSDSDITRSFALEAEDRFMATWLAGQKLDSQCAEILEVAQKIYRVFFKRFKDLPTSQYKVAHWDVGWWQVKRCLTESGIADELLAQLDELKKPVGAAIAEEALALGIISAA